MKRGLFILFGGIAIGTVIAIANACTPQQQITEKIIVMKPVPYVQPLYVQPHDFNC